MSVAAAAASTLEAQTEAEELRKELRNMSTQKERLETVFMQKIKESSP